MRILNRIHQLNFSLRAKIVGLLAGALSLSLAAYLLVGTSVLREDKLSYVYDFSLARVKSLSEILENQVSSAVTGTRFLGATFGTAISTKTSESTAGLFKQLHDSQSVEALLIMRPEDSKHFRTELTLGEKSKELGLMLARLGWTPQAYEQSGILMGAADSGLLPIGTRAVDSQGKPIAIFFLLKLSPKLEESVGKKLQLTVFDQAHHELFAFDQVKTQQAPLLKILTEIEKSGFASGAKTETISKQRFIVTYSRVLDGKITVLGLIPEASVFSAVRTLIARSFMLGISILFLALGVVLFLVRSLTTRLKQMWHATKKVSEGDFTTRVDVGGSMPDEVSDLAKSFNTMADKIDDLMKQTAHKARMEKELETAQIVQRRYFPAIGVEHPAIRLSGQVTPASECSGDWWQHVQVGDYLLMVIGDVTGHGVSAALVTAAVHSAFTLAVKKVFEKGQTPDLKYLMESLNTTVFVAGGMGESANMSCIASIVNLVTGEFKMCNASHPPPYLYRKPREHTGAGTPNQITSIMSKATSPLGQSTEFTYTETLLQLLPGDRIFWYTDGVLETRADGAKIRKTVFLKQLMASADRYGDNAKGICGKVVNETLEFFGTDVIERPDDITVIVAAVQQAAGWVAQVSQKAS